MWMISMRRCCPDDAISVSIQWCFEECYKASCLPQVNLQKMLHIPELSRNHVLEQKLMELIWPCCATFLQKHPIAHRHVLGEHAHLAQVCLELRGESRFSLATLNGA